MIHAAHTYLLSLVTVILCIAVGCTKPDNEREHPEYFNPVLSHARLLIDAGNPGEAFVYLDSAYSAFPYTSKFDLYRKYGLRAYYYNSFSRDLPSALTYVDSMLMVLRSDLDNGQYANEYPYTLSIKGSILFDQNKFTEAFHCYYLAKQFVEQHLSKCSYTQLNNNLANVLYKQQRYLDAIPYFKLAYEEGAACNTNNFQNLFDERQRCLDNIGLCFENAGKLDSALVYYKRTLHFIDSNAYLYPGEKRYIELARGVVYGNMGGTLMKLKNYDEAERALINGLEINSRPGYDNHDAQFTGIKLAQLYLEQGQLSKTASALARTRHVLDSLPYDQAELRWRKTNWSYNEARGNVAETYKAYQSYVAMKDTIDSRKRNLPIADYRNTIENFTQQHRIEILEKDGTLKSTYLVLAISVSMMSGIILYLIWRNYKQSKSSVDVLKALNTQVNDQNISMHKTLSALEQSQQENTRLMKTVAHDLRTPIVGIVSLADLMLLEGKTAEHNDMLEMIKSSGTTALQTTNDLLSANERADDMPLESLDLDELLRYSVELMQMRASVKSQHIFLESHHVYVMANEEKILRVINNLLVNSIKFSPIGKDIYLTLTQTADKKALIVVRDKGVGIPDDIQPIIFDSFTLAKRTGTSGEETFGLGLSITKQIVEAHGGHIWFESKAGEGTTFYVELPLDLVKQS